MVLWVVWLLQNEVLFRGRMVPIDGVVHNVEVLMVS